VSGIANRAMPATTISMGFLEKPPFRKCFMSGRTPAPTQNMNFVPQHLRHELDLRNARFDRREQQSPERFTALPPPTLIYTGTPFLKGTLVPRTSGRWLQELASDSSSCDARNSCYNRETRPQGNAINHPILIFALVHP
jgi:hypothetical protein